MDYSYAYIGRQIEVGRAEKRLSQEQLAESVAVSKRTVMGWEAGTSRISFEKAILICDVFGWSVDRLVGRSPESARMKMLE